MRLNNRYQILKTLGSSNLGATYVTKDTHMPSGRLCRVTQLKPAAYNPQSYDSALRQFQQEVAILDTLKHEQIPQLYDYFEWEGQFYLVQEEIEGLTLEAKVRETGPLSESEVQQLLLYLLPVLTYIHNQEVIHRAINPNNIILRQSDSKPVLNDFDAIRCILEAGGQSQTITGKSFVPPELSQGEPINFDSDLYALGMTAIYGLTGILPQYMDRDPQSRQLIWRGCAPTVSDRLAIVLDKAIQSNPGDRYRSTAEMETDLQFGQPFAPTEISSQVPTQVSHPITEYQRPSGDKLATDHRRWRSAAGIAAGLVTVLASGVASAYVYGQWQAHTQGKNRPNNLATLYKEGNFIACQASAEKALTTSKAQDDHVQELLNQCRLGEAKKLASEDKYQAAINKAQDISANATVFAEAQALITAWSREQQGLDKLNIATKLLSEGNLRDAINTLIQIPPQAQAAADAWQKIAELTHISLQNNTMNQEPNLHTQQNRNRAITINTQFGTSRVDRNSSRWPRYQKPTAQDRAADQLSWDDPWHESYDVVPGKMTLGFIYGCTNKKILQTEAVFNPSVDLKLMQAKLNRMLDGSANQSIHQKLAQVYRGKANQRTFNTGSFKGVIQQIGGQNQRQLLLAVRKA